MGRLAGLIALALCLGAQAVFVPVSEDITLVKFRRTDAAV